MKSKTVYFILFFSLFLYFVQSVKVKCHQPIFEFTSDCYTGTPNFKIVQSGKKVNFKKSLNGMVTLKFGNDGSDALKFKKCPKFYDKSVFQTMTSFSSKFKENVPFGSAEITFRNDSKITVNLDQDGKTIGVQRCQNGVDKKEEFSHCDYQGKWTTIYHHQHWKLFDQEWNQLHLVAYKFQQFYLCQTFDAKLGYNCFELEAKLLDGTEEFPVLPNDLQIEVPNNVFNLQWVDGEKKEVKSPLDICNNQKTILDWILKVANTEFVSPLKIVEMDLADEVPEYIVIDDMVELGWSNTTILQTYVILQDNKIISKGKVNPNLLGSKRQVKLQIQTKITLKKHLPIKIHFGNEEIESGYKAVITYVGHLCKSGNLCGIVKKYGVRLRDPSLCLTYYSENLAYIGFQDAQGQIVGPTFKHLLGSSILYSPDGMYPGDNIAYIYAKAPFAILGPHDQNGLLIKGQKVDYNLNGCTQHGILKIQFSDPQDDVFYHYDPPKADSFGDQPLIPDEVGTEYVEVKTVDDFKGDGTYALKDIEANTLIMLYSGFRTQNSGYMPDKYVSKSKPHAYRQSVGFCKGVVVDIPDGYEDVFKYNATIGHKANHDFNNHVEHGQVDSARFGLISTLYTIRSIKKGEEIFSHYWYPISDKLPENFHWYLDQWEEFKKSNPDSPMIQRMEKFPKK